MTENRPGKEIPSGPDADPRRHQTAIETCRRILDDVHKREGEFNLEGAENQYLTVLGLYWTLNTGREDTEVWRLARRHARYLLCGQMRSYPLTNWALSKTWGSRPEAREVLVQQLERVRLAVDTCIANGLELPERLPTETK
jgi:hypothetical protein